MITQIANEDLDPERLPQPDEEAAVLAFAMTFNGYEHFGSFEACAEAAQARARTNLTDLRNELFFEARGSRHRGDDGYLTCYRELLPLIRQRLLEKDYR